MLTIDRRRLLIHGEPRLILAGEIHYFRVPREQWAARIAQLAESGANTVASYIPWVFHELPDGTLDLTGATRPERDLAAFLDLCAEAGLWFIARPGPFQMAELKNEGLPYRLYTEHPEIVPVGWDGAPAPSRTVDYLAPAFLAEADRWYAAVMPLLAERLIQHGGPIISVQLDNEIGMLAWVTNSPDLTDDLLSDLRGWIREHRADAAGTYPALEEDDAAWARAVRSPEEAWAGALRVDLTRFLRGRFARYVDHLRAAAESHGVRDVPFLINIHGTEQGSALGISQLVETYSGRPGYLSGSDHYAGDMTLDVTTDMYVLNAFQQAVHDDDQPLTSLEFEAGTGDYGDGMERLAEPATADLKSRLFVAQGNRMLNYYLFAGGHNPPLDEPVGDGNDRLAFTGRRHGFAAPVGPEGQASPTLAPLAAAMRQLALHERHLASAVEELDDLALGLVLDSYATELRHPDSEVMGEIVRDLELHRGPGQRKALARSALFQGYRFDAVDVASPRPRSGGAGRSVLMLASSRHLDPHVQQQLADHVAGGGGLLLLGVLPERDLEGRPCRILADSLGLSAAPVRHDSSRFHPSVHWTEDRAVLDETRVGWFQELSGPDARPVLTTVDGETCGVEVRRGEGRAILLAAGLPSHLGLFGHALERLGAVPGLRLRSSVPGVVATTTRDEYGGRMLHLLNVTGYRPDVTIELDGERIDLRPAPHTGYLLARGLDVGRARIEEANAELTAISDEQLSFAEPAGERLRVVLRTDAPVTADGPGARAARSGQKVLVTADGPVSVHIG
ncbi:beta-galactosidase [Brachybacterium sp. J144]|uniref:beta-galactosidase n=1 Tax=Brachybacterium sp. J144 TaxID=3116487 RepID=UPI002E773B94|nr:beta-galactosidase [Brachybacterium sp. J144]MEE1650333.1 beta-galactosidase [Brachybacterium sp. J144]